MLAVAIPLTVVGIIASAALPVPYVVVSPGPVFNTIGDYDGRPLIQVTGTAEYPTYPTSGALDMTTVSERGGPYGPLTLTEAITAVFDDNAAVVPKEILFPVGETAVQSKQRSAADFDGAQSNAIAAALTHLGIPVTDEAFVAAVIDDGPAAGVIEPSDVILSVNGVPATGTNAVVDAVQRTPPGTELPLVVRRDGKEVPLTVKVGAKPDHPDRGYLGISIKSSFVAPFPIDFTLEGVGGPSAGLMFTLAITDELTPGELTAGRTIAGTGTIDPAGNVGAIGGIGQKMAAAKDAGAELFLAPASNCDVVRTSTPAGLDVAAVATLEQALKAIEDNNAGRPVNACAPAAEGVTATD
ncbi:MAG: hypothetical protein RLZ55_90 [Actinomycetota bacterium]|jgi:PDZ domain-containing protein